MPRRIFIIDDDESSRILYKLNFRDAPDLEIIGEFGTGEDALSQIPHLKPDVIIADYSLPGMSGIEFARKLSEYPEIKILLVTGHDLHFFTSLHTEMPNVDIVQKTWSDQDMKRIISFCRNHP
jgi:DNA-binding NarL/FixJ family response regulator